MVGEIQWATKLVALAQAARFNIKNDINLLSPRMSHLEKETSTPRQPDNRNPIV
jgi:hypothetical protein